MLGIIARSEYSLILNSLANIAHDGIKQNRTDRWRANNEVFKTTRLFLICRDEKEENLIPNSITYRGDILVQCCKFSDKHGNI